MDDQDRSNQRPGQMDQSTRRMDKNEGTIKMGCQKRGHNELVGKLAHGILSRIENFQTH